MHARTGKRSVPSEPQGSNILLSGIQGKAEADVVVAVRRHVTIAVRRPAILSIVVPAAAPVDPIRALRIVHRMTF